MTYEEELLDLMRLHGVTSSTGWYRPDELSDKLDDRSRRRMFNKAIASLSRAGEVKTVRNPNGGYAWISLAGNETRKPKP